MVPTGVDKKSYSASDKLQLVKRYGTTGGDKRTEFLRTYGLYESDFARWQEKADEAQEIQRDLSGGVAFLKQSPSAS